MLDKLEGKAKTKFESVKYKNKRADKFLLLGCVLHSIQDYSAHSYEMDLKDFMKAKNKDKLSEGAIRFHGDWYKYPSKKDRKKRKKLHSALNDNPYWDFRARGGGEPNWWFVHSPKDNERYNKAITDSVDYLQQTMYLIN